MPSTGQLEGDRENAILSNSRRSNFLEVFHAPLFKELEDRRWLWADWDVRHESKVLHQSNSTALHDNKQPD